MNIIEALKTGRPLRRNKSNHWIIISNTELLQLSVESILSDDWEVQPEIVEITKDEFYRSIVELAKSNFVYHSNIMTEDFYTKLIMDRSVDLWEQFKEQGKIK
jgi:hypothetical protein